MLVTTSKLSMPFQVLRLLLHLKEIFFLGSGLTVTENNIKKEHKQDFKNIKNVKRCRDGMPKTICKQGRDDMIVKVNSKSLSLHLFTLQLQTNVKTMQE